MDIVEVGELDPEARQAMIWLGWHLEGEAKILHGCYRKNPQTKDSTVPEFLKVLRKFCLPFLSDYKFWTEFQAIRHTQNGRTKPIQQVANKIKQLQILLAKISDWQCYNVLLEAMDPALLQDVRANINNEIEWNYLIEFCSKHDSVIHKHTSIKKDHKSRNGQKKRQQPHTPEARNNPAPTNTSWTKPKPLTRSPNTSSKFKRLTPAEKENLAKKGGCFYCRKTGHNAVNCPLKKNQIRSAVGTITHEITEVKHTSKITSAAQFILEDPTTPNTKGNSSQPPLDAAKEHLLVTMKINDQPAKTLVIQPTVGAELISSKFCTLHNLLLYPLKNPITRQMTMKGSKGSISYYTKVNCDWLGWSEERIFYVAAHKDWDVILGSPALRHAKAVINMGTMSVTIQPPGQIRIKLAPWKTTTSQKTTRKNSSTIPNLPTTAKTNIFHFSAPPTHQIIKSAATTIQPHTNPFNKFPDVFPNTKNRELPPLKPGVNHHIILKNPNAVWKPRNIKPKGKFLANMLEKLRAEEKSGRVYRSEDTSCCAMFVIRKMDDPSKPRYIHDLVKRNKETEFQPALIPSQSLIRKAVVTHPFGSKIDISDGYHTIRVHPPHEKYTAFSTPYGT